MPQKTGNQTFSPTRWQAVQTLGRQIDECLERDKVGLTLGGEPTFVAAADPALPEWQTAPLGEDKRRRARRLLLRLCRLWAPGAPIQFAVGKSYPGEDLPRWSFGSYWRRDGHPLWSAPQLLSTALDPRPASSRQARLFLEILADRLGIDRQCGWPVRKTGGETAGFAIPLLRTGKTVPRWTTCRWEGPWKKTIPLLPGKAPMGLRLPLHQLESLPEDLLEEWLDTDDSLPLPNPHRPEHQPSASGPSSVPSNSIRVALCLQPARGAIRVFLPPIRSLASFIDLLSKLEATAREVNVPVRLEGYPPPFDPRLRQLTITPDPGVLEVNLPPQESWPALVDAMESLYREAGKCGLISWKFFPDGRRVGSGGGTHFTLGGNDPKLSPWLRRPDLLRSFLSYWNHHPGLSHAFAGLFVGPTSQAPRLDQSHPLLLADANFALSRLSYRERLAPEKTDALLRNFLTDLTGNAHRAEFCIDKLFPVEFPDRRWGVVEWRGAEMTPSARHWLVLALLLRTLMVRFWREPYREELIAWGDNLYDRFALPLFIAEDLSRVTHDLRRAGFAFDPRWLKPLIDFRFPILGRLKTPNVDIELRLALEPWPVLGSAIAEDGPAQPVDCSCERLQVLLRSREPDRFQICCNGLRLPLVATEDPRQRVLGLRFKVLDLPDALHPHLPPHPPLTFDLIDVSQETIISRGRYHFHRPDGTPYTDLPATPAEARDRVRERFRQLPPGKAGLPPCQIPPAEALHRPHTLDLLRIRSLNPSE